MKIFIQALGSVISEEELKERLGPEKWKSLQGKGGALVSYTLAHEGASQPKVLGEETPQKLYWTKAVIQRLAEKIKEGTKFFLGHGVTNDHDNRETVGEVLTSFAKDIGGRLSNIIVGFFPSMDKVYDMDICSMEADIHSDGEIVSDINDVTGVALGSSNRDHPAFPGAMRMAMVQCFDVQANTNPGEGVKQMTFEEVKKAVRDMNIHPWQLYSIEEMKDDRVFGKVFDENVKMAAENERLSKENKEIGDQSKEAIRKSQIAEASKLLDSRMTEGFTDKQKSFIKNAFRPETLDDLSEKGIDSFLETAKKQYAETARLFGVTEDKSNSKTETSKDKSESEDEDRSMEEQALEIIGVK